MLPPLLVVLIAIVCSKSVLANEINNNTHTELQTLQDEGRALKEITKFLSGQLDKWNNLFLHSLEPQMISVATSLANIDSKVSSLQERAHVWDTFQLHVSAWNDQLATLDRKTNLISKGQEKMLELESKLNVIGDIEYKITEAFKKIDSIEDAVSTLKEEVQNEHLHKDHDSLFSEFATRGILSSVKMIEKKLDRLLLSQQNSLVQQKGVDKPRLTIRCNNPPYVEELLNDISSKVDVMFDKMNGREENGSDFGAEEYVDDGSGSEVSEGKNCSDRDTVLENKVTKIETISQLISNKQDNNLQVIKQELQKCVNDDSDSKLDQMISRHIVSQTKYLESLLSNISLPKLKEDKNINDSVIHEPKKTGCEDLNINSKSGVYLFGNDSKFNRNQRKFNERYCLIRNGEAWTVMQARGNHPSENFNVSWFHYKNGFGDLDKDFWFGNDFISTLTTNNNVLLRIELEDFEGRCVWAEYNRFLVLPEENKYQLIVGGYRGNATDSFSSHNGSFFSAFDRKNDQAPDCCPCSVSYGGGWWFNSCFESNLNGLYYHQGEYNGYYGGIIWETWLGSRSLKRTLIMVKISPKTDYSTLWPYFEEP